MFFTYLRRELRRRRKAALVVASGLALGIALVIVVSSVSSGMEKAQGKVLQSLYGLGTDMTVTKAAAATDEHQRAPALQLRRERGSDSDAEQSSDRVMVQGFQTLASSTVTKVDAQQGVADAVGGLSLQVVKVNGQFTRRASSSRTRERRRQPAGRRRRRRPQSRRAGSRAAAPTSTSTATPSTAPTSPSPRSAR